MAKPTCRFHVICVMLLAMIFTDSVPIPCAAATRTGAGLNNQTPTLDSDPDDIGSVSDASSNAEFVYELSGDEYESNNDDDELHIRTNLAETATGFGD